jgi:hypothetical protein
MLVYFRERIGSNLVNQVNKKMVSNQGGLSGFQRGEKKPEKEEKGEEESEPKNQGKLILDATCVPADIRYPNDLRNIKSSQRTNRRNYRLPLRTHQRQIPEKTENLPRKSEESLLRSGQKTQSISKTTEKSY